MWSRIDDSVPHHKKFLNIGVAASWLWLCGLVHSNVQLTNGYIPEAALGLLGVVKRPRTAASKLVTAGLWEKVPGGYQIHDYHDFNPRAEDTKKRREADRVRKESARRNVGPSAENPNALARARARPHPTPPHPIRTEKEQASPNVGSTAKEQASHAHPPAPQNGAGLRARFDAFMATYPKQHAPDSAWQEWKKHHPDAALTEHICKDVTRKRHSQRWQDEEGRFIPRADKYLREAQWTDLAIAPPVAARIPWRCAHTPACSNRAACEIQAGVLKYKTLARESKVPH